MAYYEHLPIYKKSMDLAVYIENMVRGFSRRFAHKIVYLNILANSAAERLPTLLVLREAIENLKVCIRLCKEVKAFNNLNHFVPAIEQAIVLARQNEGWIKSMQQKVENMPCGGGRV